MDDESIAGWLDEHEFLSLACLLSICDGIQETEVRRPSGNAEVFTEVISGSDSDGETVAPRELTGLYQEYELLRRFLDHVAETFSREKSIHGKGNRHESHGHGAKHVSASGLSFDPTLEMPMFTLYIAKNSGFDEHDERLKHILETWLRTVAVTEKPPMIEKDVLWKHLVIYYKQRLDYYVAQIRSSQTINLTSAYLELDVRVRAQRLHDLSREYQKSDSLATLQEMITLAYQLRYESLPGGLPAAGKRGRRCVSLLGRIRAAYEGFKNTCLEFRDIFKTLKIVLIPVTTNMPTDKYSVQKLISEQARKCEIANVDKKRIQKALGNKGKFLQTHCHAEIQLLLHLECSISLEHHPFPYFGCSKKTCWLCHQILNRYKDKRTGKLGFYCARQSHGRVYPLWKIQSPQDHWVKFYLQAALKDIQNVMIEKLQTLSRVRSEAVAESSTNITLTGGALRQRTLAQKRVVESSQRHEHEEEHNEMGELRDFVCSKKCMRIPASGNDPQLVDIQFFEYPKGYRGREPSPFKIPDFSVYWGMQNFDRAYRRITFEKQVKAEVNGEYLFYWCYGADLPINSYLCSLLGINAQDPAVFFWSGDVFITRFHEDENSFEFTCEDVPPELLGQRELLRSPMRLFWERNEPEDEIRRWQHFQAGEEKRESDKQIMWERMSPTERDLVSKSPGLLGILSITSCDDGAMLLHSFRQSTSQPDMTVIETLHRTTALERIGWESFSSKHLRG